MLNEQRLREDVRRLFELDDPEETYRIAAEVEFIPLDTSTGTLCPLRGDGASAVLPFLRRYGGERGWTEAELEPGVPYMALPEGGSIFFEPGGQIEYATAPHTGPSALLATLHSVVEPLRRAAASSGIDLAGVGMDPLTPSEDAPLQLPSERYRAMDRYFASIGPLGRRMMRQSASCQFNLDYGPEPLLAWYVANAAAPLFVAIFANSAVYAGAPTGHRSYRSHLWRNLDPSRTGLLRAPLPADSVDDDGGAAIAVEQYLRFALNAPWILGARTKARDRLVYPPFAEHIERGTVSAEDWRTHLSMLFPEVRPRGYLEVRGCDALDPRHYAAPTVLLAGLIHHPPTLRKASLRLPAPDSDLLERAGHVGLNDPELATAATTLVELGLGGAVALGPARINERDLAAAREFFERYTFEGRSPADGRIDLVAC